MTIKEFKTQYILGTLKEIPGVVNPFKRCYMFHLVVKNLSKKDPSRSRLSSIRGMALLNSVLVLFVFWMIYEHMPRIFDPIFYVEHAWWEILLEWVWSTLYPVIIYFVNLRGFGTEKTTDPTPLRLPYEFLSDADREAWIKSVQTSLKGIGIGITKGGIGITKGGIGIKKGGQSGAPNKKTTP